MFPGGHSGFQMTGMIEWGQNQNPPKIPRASNETQKNSLDQNLTLKKFHAEFPNHKNFQKALRLQHTFGSAIFFKFGFLGQNRVRRIIFNFWKKFLKKAKYWRRNGGFTFLPEVKVYLLIDSPMARMQSTETIFAGIYLYRCHELTTQLISIVVLTTQHFWY